MKTSNRTTKRKLRLGDTPIAKTVVNLRERVRLMQQSLERFEKDIGIHGKSDEEVMGIKDWGGL